MLIFDAVLSAVLNLVIFVLIPLGIYYAYQKWRKKRDLAEVLKRTGLQIGSARYIWYAVVFSAVMISAMIIWPLPIEPFVRQGSPQAAFNGLGLSGTSVILALLYGVVKTGFSEEFFFRGLIAGSLFRRLPPLWANLIQATIFLLPHLLVLLNMPELWWLLPLVFVIALLKGWLRMKSESIVGPWILHASGNVVMCLDVAIRTAGG